MSDTMHVTTYCPAVAKLRVKEAPFGPMMAELALVLSEDNHWYASSSPSASTAVAVMVTAAPAGIFSALAASASVGARLSGKKPRLTTTSTLRSPAMSFTPIVVK